MNIARWSKPEKVPAATGDAFQTAFGSSSSSSSAAARKDDALQDPTGTNIPLGYADYIDLSTFDDQEDMDPQDDSQLNYEDATCDPKRPLDAIYVPQGEINLVSRCDEPVLMRNISDCFSHFPLEYRNDRSSPAWVAKRNRNLTWDQCLDPVASKNFSGCFHSSFPGSPASLHCPNSVEQLEFCFSLPESLRSFKGLQHEIETRNRISLVADLSHLNKGIVIPNQIEVIEQHSKLPVDMDLRLTTRKYADGGSAASNVPLEWTNAALVNNLGSAAEPYVHHIVPRWSSRSATNERVTLYRAPDDVVNGALLSRWVGQNEHEIRSEIRRATIQSDVSEPYAEIRMPARGDPTTEMPSITSFLVCEYWMFLTLFSQKSNWAPPAIVTIDSKTVVRIHPGALEHLVTCIYKVVNKGKLFMDLQSQLTVTLEPLDKAHLGDVKEALKRATLKVAEHYDEFTTYNPVAHPEFIVKIRITYYKLSSKAVETKASVQGGTFAP